MFAKCGKSIKLQEVVSDAGLKSKRKITFFIFFPAVDNSERGAGLLRLRANALNSDQWINSD